jgi:hypothetical protein
MDMDYDKQPVLVRMDMVMDVGSSLDMMTRMLPMMRRRINRRQRRRDR